MNTKLIFGILVVIIIGAVGWMLLSRQGDTFVGSLPGAAGFAGGEQGTGTIGSLLARAGDYRCHVQVADATVQSEGMIFVSGGKTRGDFQTVANNEAVRSSMINDGQFVYTWTDVVPQGFKTAIGGDSVAQAEGNIDPSIDVTYNCEQWGNPDQDVFLPPGSVEFIEV